MNTEKHSKRKKQTKEIKKLLKANSDELDAMIKKAPEGWDSEKAQNLIQSIRKINEDLSNLRKPKWKIPETSANEKWMNDSYLHEINKKIMEKGLGAKTGLTCPKCKAPDHDNFMNGMPWCFKCNVPLSREGEQQNKIRVLSGKYDVNVTFKPMEA